MQLNFKKNHNNGVWCPRYICSLNIAKKIFNWEKTSTTALYYFVTDNNTTTLAACAFAQIFTSVSVGVVLKTPKLPKSTSLRLGFFREIPVMFWQKDVPFMDVYFTESRDRKFLFTRLEATLTPVDYYFDPCVHERI